MIINQKIRCISYIQFECSYMKVLLTLRGHTYTFLVLVNWHRVENTRGQSAILGTSNLPVFATLELEVDK